MRGPGHNGDEHGHGDGSKIGDDNIGLAEHHQGGGYYYRRDRVLTTQADAKEVFEVVNRRFANKKRPAPDYDSDPKPLYRGSRVVVVPMDPARFDRVAVPEIVGELRSEHRARGPLGVAPDHVLSLASHPDPFPANAPQSGTGLARVGARAGSALGKGVNVAVFDSGVDRANAILGPRLDSATGASDDEDPVGATLGRYSGHGTFVAGLVLQQAPMATICARKAFGEDGFVTDTGLATLLRARMPDEVDIVNLSCGGPTHDNIGMPAVEEWLGRFRNSHPTTVVIAACGNDGVGVPYFPAAFKGVIGVAATTEKKTRACFSNHGSWVDACAPGVDVRSTYLSTSAAVAVQPVEPRPDCGRAQKAGQDTFSGWAVWSGTSFAAPQVAGAIAAEMTRLGPRRRKTAAQAAFDLLGTAPHLWDGNHHLGVFVGGTTLAFS